MFPPAVYKRSRFFMSWPTLNMVSLFNFRYSKKCQQYLTVVLLCISLRNDDAEYIFMFIGYLYIVFDELCVQIFCSFKNQSLALACGSVGWSTVPCTRAVVSIPGQSTCLDYSFNAQLGHTRGQSIDVSLSHQCFSLSLFPFISL